MTIYFYKIDKQNPIKIKKENKICEKKGQKKRIEIQKDV